MGMTRLHGQVRSDARAPPSPFTWLPRRDHRDLSPHSHDASDSVDNVLESSAIGIRAVKISLVALGLTALVQVAIVIVSGSIALAADTVHNFSDALTAVPLWIAFALGTRAATRRYTYGSAAPRILPGCSWWR